MARTESTLDLVFFEGQTDGGGGELALMIGNKPL